jgi:hypothetical protein
MKTYEVTLHRVVEHTTTFRVNANDEDQAEDFVLNGEYDEIVQDSEEGEMEDPEVTSIEQV